MDSRLLKKTVLNGFSKNSITTVTGKATITLKYFQKGKLNYFVTEKWNY